MTAFNATLANRLYRSYWQDGSVDLFAGVALALVGVAWLSNAHAVAAVAPAVAVPVWAAFRAKCVAPRLGQVKFDEGRRTKLRRGHFTTLVLGIVALLLSVGAFLLARQGSSPAPWVRESIAALPAVLVGLLAVLSALLFDIRRLAFYGLACVAAGAAVAALGLDPGWSLLAGGCVATVSGVLLFQRFLRQFPVLNTELE